MQESKRWAPFVPEVGLVGGSYIDVVSALSAVRVTKQPSTRAAIDSAWEEDTRTSGIPVNPQTQVRLRSARATSTSLPPELQHDLTSLISRPLPNINIISNRETDSLARELATNAFCVGTDIFIASELLHPANRSLLCEVLCHEASHIANFTSENLIRCWEGKGHSKLSGLAFDTFKADFAKLVADKGAPNLLAALRREICLETNDRDWEERWLPWKHFLDRTLPYLLGGYLPYTASKYVPHLSVLRIPSEVSDFVQHNGIPVPILSMLFHKGEGPAHGEGTNYVEADPQINSALNLAVENNVIQDAVKLCRSSTKGKDFIDDLAEVIGDLLHTTQDRAAHREGRRGFGHNDPRVDLMGWQPDEPTVHNHTTINHHESPTSWWICSVSAYNKAYNNSCEALERFFRTLGVSVVSAWDPKPVFCTEQSNLSPIVTADSNYSPGCCAARSDMPQGFELHV